MGLRLTVLVLLAYLAAALFAEFSRVRADWRDETPAWNRPALELRLLPPLAAGVSADGRTERFLLGSDNLGRSVLLRLLQGSRIALHVGLVASLLAVPFGTLLGLVAGYRGGAFDAVATWLAATVAAIPSAVLVLAVSMLVGKGLAGVYLGIGLTTWVGVYRTVRGETMKHRSRAYVQSALALGCSDARVMLRHILPNVAHVVIVAFSLRFPAAVGTEVFMSFLGLGAQNEPSWGVMLDNARGRLWQGVWWEGFFVTAAVFGLVLAANRLGDILRDRLDPTRA